MPQLSYKRVILKLSGEMFSDNNKDLFVAVEGLAKEIQTIVSQGVELGIVIGGGNILRGVSAAAKGMNRTRSDQVGMLATCINALVLQEALEKQGIVTRTLMALAIPNIAELYVPQKAKGQLKLGETLILAGGVGSPYFTTDSAAALRAAELEAELILKATKVMGVFDKDPNQHNDAKKYDRLSYSEVLSQNLGVMDPMSVAMCRENGIPTVVFQMGEGQILRVLSGESVGTQIRS